MSTKFGLLIDFEQWTFWRQWHHQLRNGK